MAAAAQLVAVEEAQADLDMLLVESAEPCGHEARPRPRSPWLAGTRRMALVAAAAMLAGAGVATVGLTHEAPWRLLANTEGTVGLRGKIFKKKQVDMVLCGTNVATAVYRAAALGMSIRNSVVSCENLVAPTVIQERVCAVRIQSGIANGLALAVSLAGSASACVEKPTRGATCAAGVMQFVAALSGVAQTATEVSWLCNEWWRDVAVPPNGGTTPTTTSFAPTTNPWLPTSTVTPQPTFAPDVPTLVPAVFYQELNNIQFQNYQVNIASCWAHAGIATTYMVRAALGIYDAVSACDPEALAVNKTKVEKRCTVDILVILQALSDVVRFLSVLVINCAGAAQLSGDGGQIAGGNTGAMCTAGVSGLLSNTLKFIAPAIVFKTICPADLHQQGPMHPHAHHRVPFFGAAR